MLLPAPLGRNPAVELGFDPRASAVADGGTGLSVVGAVGSGVWGSGLAVVGAALVGLAFPEMLPAALFCVSDCEVCPGLFCWGEVCC